jgi:acetylornithine deacetylase/succinyl-diaminopimelate desuccinylase-like protein
MYDKQIADLVTQHFGKQEGFLRTLASTNSANSAVVVDNDPDEPVELEVSRLIRKELSAVGINSEQVAISRKRPNVVAVVGQKRSRKQLILHAHMDTAPPSPQYRSDPFQPFLRGNKLYGLGMMHMKAPISAFVYAARILEAMKLPLAGKLILQFSVDEVPGGESKLGLKSLLSQGLKAKAAILGYPGSSIGVGHRGGYRFKLTTRGESVVTSSQAWQKKEAGKNAVLEMMRAIEALQDWELPFKPARAFPHKRPVFTFPTVIQGGDAYDIVPDKCEAVGDVRLMPGNSDRQVRLRLIEKLDSIPDLDYTVDDLVYVPAVEIDQKEEIVVTLQEQFEAVTGTSVPVEGVGSWNSGWMFIQRDIPTVIQIPLRGGKYRGNVEWVSLNSLKQLTETLVRTTIAYLGVKKQV